MRSEGYWTRFLQTIKRLSKERIEKNVATLIEERNLLKKTLDKARVGIMILDEKGEILYQNPYMDRIALKEWKEGKSFIKEILKKREWEGEVSKNGTAPRYFWIWKTTWDNIHLLTFLEVTEKKKEEEEKFLNQKFSSFHYLSAGVAHEVGNPLNALKIHTQLLQRALSVKDLEKVEKHAKILEEEIERLEKIIKNFLTALRPVSLNKKEMRVEDILLSTMELLAPSFEKKGVKYILEFSPNTPSILIDGEKMKQVFINLLQNALEATPKGKKVVITTGEEKGMVYTVIMDEGEGIPPEHINRIFEPFFSTRPKGSGLGLVIAYKIVKAHGGEIKVKSKPGEGSTFIVYIPVERKEVKLPVPKEK